MIGCWAGFVYLVCGLVGVVSLVLEASYHGGIEGIGVHMTIGNGAIGESSHHPTSAEALSVSIAWRAGAAGLAENFVQQRSFKRFADRAIAFSVSDQRLNEYRLQAAPHDETTPITRAEQKQDRLLVVLAF